MSQPADNRELEARAKRVTPREWLNERIGVGAVPASSTVAGGPSFAYTLGWVLVMFLAIEGLTGIALAAFYSPSSTDAWASVAYIQDQMSWGWLVRGLHHHGGSALVIVTGLHLVQTAFYGAYKRPRELVWWIGIVLMLLVLGFTVTGYVLRWDQAGYWANRVEIGIAAATPILGGTIRKLALGGNEYGNLTLTRFYALHVALLPALLGAVVGGHIWLSRRLGATPNPGSPVEATPRWPDQTLRAAIAAATAFGVLLIYTIGTHGADLAAPADPSAAYDARPLWYFRWLFELRAIAGSLEGFVALAAPALVIGFLAALPIIDHGPDRAWQKRKPFLGALAAVLGLIALLTLVSLASDGGEALAKRRAAAEKQAFRTRSLALKYGVPATGPQDLFAQIPMWKARTLYAQRCFDCHDATSKDRKGPIIGPGHKSRAWFRGFLADPSGDPYWGHTKLAKTDDAMKAVALPPVEIDELAEMLYAEGGATDIDAAKRERGKAVFEKACTDCHSVEEGAGGASGPGLGRLGSRDWFTTFIGNPKSAMHMGADKSEMPRFDRELTVSERDAIAEYLVWLRSATTKDVQALEPL